MTVTVLFFHSKNCTFCRQQKENKRLVFCMLTGQFNGPFWLQVKAENVLIISKRAMKRKIRGKQKKTFCYIVNNQLLIF